MLCIIISIFTYGCSSSNSNNKNDSTNKSDKKTEEPGESVGQSEDPKGVDTQPQGEFLGTDFTTVDFIILTKGEFSIYYDLLQDYQMEFAVSLAEAFSKAGDTIAAEDNKELELFNEKGYVEMNPGHYYLEIQFSAPQDIILGDKIRFYCDDILIDLTDHIIYERMEGEYVGILKYEEETLQSILTVIQNDIDSMSKMVSESPVAE
jgi:hypothetical protein